MCVKLCQIVLAVSVCVMQVETEIFDKIDELIASGHGDEEYRELFKEMSVPTPPLTLTPSHTLPPSPDSTHSVPLITWVALGRCSSVPSVF